MITKIPVFQDMNGYYTIAIYEPTSEGYFKRTAKKHFRGLTGIFAGVSSALGTIEAKPRQPWESEMAQPNCQQQRRTLSTKHIPLLSR